MQWSSSPKVFVPLCAVLVIFGMYGLADWMLSDSFPEVADRWHQVVDFASTLIGLLGGSFTTAQASFAWLRRAQIRTWFTPFRQRPDPLEGLGEAVPIERSPFSALVVPFSRREVPQWLLCHLRPKIVAFVYTPQTCEDCADFSTNHVTGLGKPIQSIRSSEQIRDGIDALHRPFDPVAAYHHTLAILRELQGRGIPPSRIAIDCTGGTAPMSIGAHLFS